MLKSHIGEMIKQSPYKRSYIEKIMKVSRNTLSNWSTGKTYPTAPQLFKLAKLLNVSIDDLYSYEDDET